MKRHLIVFLIIGLILTAVGIPFAGPFERHRHIYWSVWPYFVLSATSAIAGAVGLLSPSHRRTALLVAIWSCMVTPVLAVFAVTKIPGGDDANGMAWMFIVLPASALAALWSSMVLIAGFPEPDR